MKRTDKQRRENLAEVKREATFKSKCIEELTSRVERYEQLIEGLTKTQDEIQVQDAIQKSILREQIREKDIEIQCLLEKVERNEEKKSAMKCAENETDTDESTMTYNLEEQKEIKQFGKTQIDEPQARQQIDQ